MEILSQPETWISLITLTLLNRFRDRQYYFYIDLILKTSTGYSKEGAAMGIGPGNDHTDFAAAVAKLGNDFDSDVT